MYTVVIAEQKHLDSIREHDLFLQPFLEDNKATFCAWNTEGETLAESVPDLREAVKRGDRWRAIIVADESCRTQKNPFDCVRHKDPVREEGEEEEAYRERRLKARLESYEAAAKQPLSRLCAYLCTYPSVSAEGEGLLNDDPDFRDYRTADRRKKELQREIIGTEPEDFFKPVEIVCVARRTYEDEQYDIRTAWTEHVDLEYSRFADYNLYYPKMRYIVFDIVPPEHRAYRFENVMFLYVLLLLAQNDVPQDALKSGKVYSLVCENDRGKLCALLQEYDDRLSATQKMLEDEVAVLKHTPQQTISDVEMADTFFGRSVIAVHPEKSFSESDIYVHPKRFEFFSDRPEEETAAWKDEYARSKAGLQRYMKQPKRAVRSAVFSTRVQSEDRTAAEKVHLLNEQQIDDLMEHTDNVEASVVATIPENLSDPTRYFAEAEKGAEKVSDHLKTRMTRKTGFAAIAIAIVAFLAGIVPILLTGTFSLFTLFGVIGAVAIILAAAFICLLVQRAKLRGKLRSYNDVMNSISRSIQSNLERYSLFLGHVCDMRKGKHAENALKENCSENLQNCRVYQKHILDIKNLRSECGLTFSQFLMGGKERNPDAVPYLYDFRKGVNYRYPIITGEAKSRRVEYLQKGNMAELPVDFISRVELRREELYD